jgi:hypothetical protein
MKLAILLLSGSMFIEAFEALSRRGFRAIVVDRRRHSSGGEQICVFVPVPEQYVPELRRVVAEFGQLTYTAVNPLLPLVDPGEYYVSDPAAAIEGGATVYLTSLRRYEEIS